MKPLSASSISQRDAQHIFQSLRFGLVPERGIEAFAVGIEPQRDEIKRQLDFVRQNEGTIKFLRGGYGCGKTFMARLALLDAQAQDFARSFVVVSDNDLHFHRFDDVYRKVMTELGTASCHRGALGDILDRWIARIESALIELGADPDAADFDEKVYDRIRFMSQDGFASLRQAQLELRPFDQACLVGVAIRLHDLYPAKHRDRHDEKNTRAFIERLVADVTTGFKGDVGVVPRQFLREFVNQMDLVDEQPEYDPMKHYAFKLGELNPQEQHSLTGKPLLIADDAVGEPVMKEDVW